MLGKKFVLFIVVSTIFTVALGCSNGSCADNGKIDDIDMIDGRPYNKIITDTTVDGINFRRYYYEVFDTVELLNEEDGTAQIVDFSSYDDFMLPVGGNAAIEKIRADLLKTFNYSGPTIEQDLDKEYDNYTAPEDAYSYENKIDLVSIAGDFISFYVSSFYIYVYQQSHGWTTTTYSVYNMETGEKIMQDDILDASESARLAVANKLRSLLVEYLDGDESEVKVYDVMDMLNGNFVIGENGLVYCYDPSSVAPYMAGEPELELPKDWLRPYLNVEGPLYKYWFGKKQK